MNTFGIKRSDRCSREEAKEFFKKVENFVITEKLPYTKLIGLRTFGGQVRVYTGSDITQKLLRNGRKRINDNLYEITKTRTVKECFPVYRVDDWEDEKITLKEFLQRGNNDKS